MLLNPLWGVKVSAHQAAAQNEPVFV